MGATKKQFSLFIFSSLRPLLLGLLLTLMIQKGVLAKTKVEILNNFFYQDGNGGGQVADGTGSQQITITEPVFYFDTDLSHNTKFFGHALIDLWSSASEAIFDTQTGASGQALAKINTTKQSAEIEDENEGGTPNTTTTTHRKLQNRKAFNVGLTHKIKTWSFTPDFGYSTEFDYHSINGGVTVEKRFAEDNFTLSAGYHLFSDQTYTFDVPTGKFLSWQNKTSHTITASASQILSKSDLVLVGYSLTLQNGYLAGTQNTVDLKGTRINEQLPNQRTRQAANVRYVHGFNDTISFHQDYRFYVDNWGLIAHTIEPSLCFAFHEDDGLVRLFYRYHQQNGVNYYADSFTSAQDYMTSDSDLAPLSAHEGGMQTHYQWTLDTGPLQSWGLNFGALYYQRSNNLYGILLQTGIGGVF